MIEEPNFISGLPRVRLTALPTPLERALRLEQALRDERVMPPRIYIKRDDLLGLALGGNKIRNLEFSLGAALADGVTDIVTVGRAQSNHCRLTAAACAKVGLRAHLVMSGERPAAAQGNLLLSQLFGASVHFTGTEDRAVRESMAARISEEIAARGGKALVLPVGGSDARGAVGHALLLSEIVAQYQAIGERPWSVMLATATGGTQAGLEAASMKLGLGAVIVGFSVHEREREMMDKIDSLTRAVATVIGGAIDDEWYPIVDDTQLGDGYGVPSRAGEEATRLLAHTEGLLMDPVYTAKAMAGLLAAVRERRLTESASVVFIHTGGTPVLFADLPATPM